MSAVKGLAEAWKIPVAQVSRLEVMANCAEITSAALDAHRHEVFLRLQEPDQDARELLAGEEELRALALERNSRPGSEPERIAICDQAAAALLVKSWPQAELVWTAAPTASDALRFCRSQIAAGTFADVALMDGHYLRRSDAEIFGEANAARLG
jgi:tRNA threonylcarbamoyladenosine biosynthesis protein TsaB